MKKRLFSFFLCLSLACSMLVPAAALELDDAKALLEEYYVDPIPDEVMAQTSLEELLSALGDPYTTYYTKEAYDTFLSSVNGSSLVGVGVSIQNVFMDGFEILSVLPDSPALEAGWQAGDVIVAVDGVEMTPDSDVRAAIAGEEGTTVSITLRRVSTGELEEFTLTRRTIQIPVVTFQQLDGMGLIDCTSFGENTADVVWDALIQLEDDINVWVMDLTQNAGGIAQTAASSASYFTGGGTLVYFRYYNDGYQYLYTPPANEPLTEKPLIVLLSPYSASGSELLAAAIRDYQSGISIGQRSYGKGIAQNILDASTHPELFDNDAFKITTSRFFSPCGTTNHITGILPSLVISHENMGKVATLLCAPEPDSGIGYVKLELSGQTFYIDLDQALTPGNKRAFTELLEALPPSAMLYRGFTTKWEPITPEGLADVLRLNFFTRTYNDIVTSPYREQIHTLAVYGLLSQYQGTSFHPTKAMTRGEFCTLVANALDLPENTDLLSFSDVSPDSPHASGISALLNRGFISGLDDGTFRPDEAITNEAALCILWRAAQWLNMVAYDLSESQIPIQNWLDYTDFSDWAQAPVWRLEQLEIPTRLQAPTDTVTREVAAAMLCTLLENLNLIWN